MKIKHLKDYNFVLCNLVKYRQNRIEKKPITVTREVSKLQKLQLIKKVPNDYNLFASR